MFNITYYEIDITLIISNIKNTSKNRRRCAKPHHRDSTFPAIRSDCHLTCDAFNAQVRIDRSIIMPILSYRHSNCNLIQTIDICRSTVCMSYTNYRQKHYTASWRILSKARQYRNVSVCYFILQQCYLLCFLCSKVYMSGIIRLLKYI